MLFEMSFISSAGEEPTGDEIVTAVGFFLLSLVYGQASFSSEKNR